MVPRSGTPYSIRSGASRAEISGTGATLRELYLDGSEVLDGFAADVVAPGGAGQVLAPWPNRLEDGTYAFEGTNAVAALNEPERKNAIHGLVRWSQWSPVAAQPDAVSLETVIVPHPAYPWRLRLEITYRIGLRSLEVSFAASNEDDRPVPFAIGFHPYFLAAGGDVDAASVSVRAAEHLVLDGRALPTGTEPVAGGPYAPLSEPGGLALAGRTLDDCFTGLDRGADGTASAVYLPGAGSRAVNLILGPAFTHLMCFTGDTLAPPRRRRAMAFEPMTCAPNALHTGEGITSIPSGGSARGSFEISIG